MYHHHDTYIPKLANDILKHPKYWDAVETKKAPYVLKSRYILIYALSFKVFYSISNYTSAKGVRDAL